MAEPSGEIAQVIDHPWCVTHNAPMPSPHNRCKGWKPDTGSCLHIGSSEVTGESSVSPSTSQRNFEVVSDGVRPCRGDHLCLAERHIHGCYADRGCCDSPAKHSLDAAAVLDENERLREALNAVVALHERVLDGYLMSDVCAECSDPEEGRWASWPCATSDAIEAALSGSDERG